MIYPTDQDVNAQLTPIEAEARDVIASLLVASDAAPLAEALGAAIAIVAALRVNGCAPAQAVEPPTRLSAETAAASDEELNARASDPIVRAATVAAIRYLMAVARPAPPTFVVREETSHVVALVVSALIHEGFTIVEKPWKRPKCCCDEFCDCPCPVHATPEAHAAWDGGLGDLSKPELELTERQRGIRARDPQCTGCAWEFNDTPAALDRCPNCQRGPNGPITHDEDGGMLSDLFTKVEP
jgi:hypothetical protein